MTATTTAVTGVPGGARGPQPPDVRRRRVRPPRATGPAPAGDPSPSGEGSGPPATSADPRPRPHILVADSEPLTATTIAGILGERGGTVVGSVSRGQDVLRLASQLQPDLVLIDAGLHGTATGDQGRITDGLDTAAELHRHHAPVVLLLEDRAPVDERLAASGALACLAKPLRPAAVLPTVQVALARSVTLSALRDQVDDITGRLRDRAVIERAKGLLMERRGMTEPQAFRWLQRTAMDRRTPMATVAVSVVDRLDESSGALPTITPPAAVRPVVPPQPVREQAS